MGQEERKNKAKLEKTQINVAQSNAEYEAAVKVLEETTSRWNRDWKAAADKFQDLEEERLDFTKASLWSFANIASTVCVSDDASCEKIRLSLENCEVEKDIVSFIKERGTGQEIPEAPKYINFCRGDINDTQSEASEDDNYSVAQFQRTINPAFRSSSPQPSVLESHHDPKSSLARELGHHEPETPEDEDKTMTPQANLPDRLRQPLPGYQQEPGRPHYQATQHQLDYQSEADRLQYHQSQHGPLAAVPHDPYPMDGMTMLCRTGPPLGPPSDRSSALSSNARPSSRESQPHSDYSNPTSFTSQDPPSGKQSPLKQDVVSSPPAENASPRKSGFFQSHSPFKRKSKHNLQEAQSVPSTPSSKNTWSVKASTINPSTPSQRPPMYGRGSGGGLITDRSSGSPEPDPRASFQLNVGNNVFDVVTPSNKSRTPTDNNGQDLDLDPIAQALAELKGVTKSSSSRMSADHYHGIPTPAPGASSASRTRPSPMSNGAIVAGMRGTPPPSYDQPVSRLDAPQPAFTSKAMQKTSQKYQTQTQNMFSTPQRPVSRNDYGSGSQQRPTTRGNDIPRATSPLPPRSVSPRPNMQVDPRQGYRSASPNPYSGSQPRHYQQSGSPQKPPSSQRSVRQGSYNNSVHRSVSPQPYHDRRDGQRTSDMSVQLAPVSPDDVYGGGRSSGSGRPLSLYNGDPQLSHPSQRSRSKSVVGGAQYGRDGRPILHFGKLINSPRACNTNLLLARAMYMYQAAIAEELSFKKGDVLAVLRHQDDGWWEAEVHGKTGGPGLVPSNYLQTC
jgi:hypothetical protein